MKVFVMDLEGEGTGVDIAYRIQDAGHSVRYWLPSHRGEEMPYGKGLFERPTEWEPQMEWAELIILTGNSKYEDRLAPYFGRGYPIFGSNASGAALELDRGHGQEILKEHGIEVAPYEVVETLSDAISLVKKTDKGYAMKPWGGDGDKSMTAVAENADEALFILERWGKLGKFKGQLMMQEKVEGVEVGISGFFGPGGWLTAKEESFEHKRFMNDDLGENTGEMGTVIRHVEKSKLFDKMLAPLTEYLHFINYVGDCSVNCIVDKSGKPWPLEFTTRLGWPDFCIRQAVIESDPAQWMFDLVHGKDTLEISDDIAVGVLIAHGDFPKAHDAMGVWAGYPLYGITRKNEDSIHYQQVMDGTAPFLIEGKVKRLPSILTAGSYVMVVTGTGRTVRTAQSAAYAVAWDIKIPSNRMFRTDIGDRLEKDLPLLQKHGYATGMKF